MSVGLLQSEGFSFHSAHGFLSCLIANNNHRIIVSDVCGGLPVIIEGGVIDNNHDIDRFIQLCGARLMKVDGKGYVCSPMIDTDDPHTGMGPG